MKTVLCIGGLDPAGRAGLLVDAAAVRALGGRPLCVAAALTFQSSRRMDGFEAVPAGMLARQIDVLLEDEPIHAIKIGQIGSAENAEIIARKCPEVPVVVDTPLISTSGTPLYPLAQIAGYAPLLARATLLTPNAPEVFLLRGLHHVDGQEAALDAAVKLSRAVLVKGGHIPGELIEDVLLENDAWRRFESRRLPGHFRGTGCRLASAIATRLANGDALCDAIETARDWLHEELKQEMR